MAAARCGRFLLLDDQRFGREQQARDRGGVLQRRARHLRRIDHASLHEIFVRVGQRVVAEVLFLRRADLLDDDGAFTTRVLHDYAERLFDRATHDIHTDLLVALSDLHILQAMLRANQCDATARDDPFFDRGTRRVQRVFDASLLFLHFRFGRGADIDDGHATGKLRETLLELLTIVVRRGLVDRCADFLHAAFDVLAVAGTVDDRRVVLVDHEALSRSEIRDDRVLELEADFVGDDLSLGQRRDILQHRLAAIAKARGLHGADAERAAQLVHDQRREGFAFDVFRDDEQRLAELGNLLQHRKEVLHRRDLLVVDEDERTLEDDFHLLWIGDEVRRQIAAVELHTVNCLQRRLEALGLFNGNDAVLADLLHRFRDQVADFGIIVRRDRADLRDFLPARRRHRDLLQLFDDAGDGLLDAALERHRIGASRHVLEAFTEDRLREHRRRRRAVTGKIRRLGRDFLHHLRAHVLDRIREFDFLRDRHAVLGHGRRAKLLVDDDVASLRTERDFHRFGQLIDAALQCRACLDVKMQFFSSHVCVPFAVGST